MQLKDDTAPMINVDCLNFINAFFSPHCNIANENTNRLQHMKESLKNSELIGLGISNCCAIEIIDDNGDPVAPNDWIEFYQALPTKDRVAIADKFNYASNVPTVQIVCPKCSATREVAIPIDKGFFRLS